MLYFCNLLNDFFLYGTRLTQLHSRYELQLFNTEATSFRLTDIFHLPELKIKVKRATAFRSYTVFAPAKTLSKLKTFSVRNKILTAVYEGRNILLFETKLRKNAKDKACRHKANSNQHVNGNLRRNAAKKSQSQGSSSINEVVRVRKYEIIYSTSEKLTRLKQKLRTALK